jgi:thiol-disulfide isomerase/thioredoxin
MIKIIILVMLAICINTQAAINSGKMSMPVVGDKISPSILEYITPTGYNLSGKAVLVEFWATWCPPCRKNIPHLNDLHAKYPDLVMIGLTNEDETTITKFEKEVPIKYIVGGGTSNEVFQEFGVEFIPTAFLIDKTGTVVWTGSGYPTTIPDDLIKSVLK